MADETDYQKMVALVESIGEAPSPESITVDVSEAFQDRLQVRSLKYLDVSEPLDRLEAHRPAPQQRAVVQQPSTPKPQVQPQVQPQQPAPQVPKRQVSKEMTGAASKLRSMVGGAGKEFAESVTKRVEETQEAGLVMPKLSLQDQVSDLDKIKEGLDEKVFDRDQLKIIAQEIRGISQVAAREDVGRMSSDQRELAEMRNQRIKEIKSGLNAA